MNLGILKGQSQYDPSMDSIPVEIMAAMQVIQNWADERGMDTFEIGTLCSRNHAETLRQIVNLLTETP